MGITFIKLWNIKDNFWKLTLLESY